jgi:hypothetical protein
MPRQMGYWVDLHGYQFDDTSSGTWIQAMPLGEYEHPVHSTISITMERIKRFASNVMDKVRGQDLDIDYDHKANGGEAAGWVKQAEAREDGLWLFVEWTQRAHQLLKDRAYRYFSPEFVDEWVHPKTSQKYEDVLFGGGITNRPFLKDILPINMSELVEASDEPPKSRGGQMDPKALRKQLGLSEDATDEQVSTKLSELVAASTKQPEPPDITKLAETHPAIKALQEQAAQQAKELAEAQAALRLAEAERRVVKLGELAKTNQRALPVPVTTKLSEFFAKHPKALSDAVAEIVEELAKTGFVQLGEVGSSTNHGSNDASPIKQFQDAVAKVQTDNKLGYADAVTKVSFEQPQLFEEYRQASFAGRE